MGKSSMFTQNNSIQNSFSVYPGTARNSNLMNSSTYGKMLKNISQERIMESHRMV
jgi:hypothetical protein